MPGPRRKARVIALKVLYEVDLVGHDPEAALERLFAEEPLPEETKTYAHEIVTGVLRNLARIDPVLQEAAPAWPLVQMSRVDKNILRLAIFEILLDNKVPLKAAINEAVELAKEFGSDNSPKFVNGVLGAVSARVGRQPS